MELLIETMDVVAELRMARECVSTFTEADNVEQAAWVDDILERMAPPGDDAPAVCLLDTGINRGHPLLGPAIAECDRHTDHGADGAADVNGHGTRMAGPTCALAVYPVGGWWLESTRARPRISPVHYSLLVSIETPGVEADLDSAVVAQAGVEVAGRVPATVGA